MYNLKRIEICTDIEPTQSRNAQKHSAPNTMEYSYLQHETQKQWHVFLPLVMQVSFFCLL